MTLEEAQGDAVEVWPDNIQAVNLFVAMSTQWRTGQRGATGLDYSVLPFMLRTHGVKKTDHAAVLEDIRTLEDVALETMRKNNK